MPGPGVEMLGVARTLIACRAGRWCRWALIAFLTASHTLPAQQPPGLLAGVVRDGNGEAVADAIVVLDANTTSQRLTRSDSAGRFRFERVARGPHELAVAIAGYRTEVRRIDMPDGALEVSVVLQDIVSMIDTVRVQARRMGIFGTVIAHEGFRPLAEAEVHVIGLRESEVTAADGRFEFAQVGRGSHVVYVKRRGYQGRMLSVLVPRDSAVELALVLDATTEDADQRRAILLSEFDSRRRWMMSGKAALISRHELAGRGNMSLWDALRYSPTYLAKGLILDEEACLYVDGQFRQMMTAKDIDAAEVEAVEVYGLNADLTNTVTFRNENLPSRLPPGAYCGRSENPVGVRRARSLEDRVMNFGRGAKANPARIEAIVVWLRR